MNLALYILLKNIAIIIWFIVVVVFLKSENIIWEISRFIYIC